MVLIKIILLSASNIIAGITIGVILVNILGSFYMVLIF